MDWSRAKTILIISFALLNGLLGYQLWVSWHEQNSGNTVSLQTVEELNQLLTAEQIDLQDVLPLDLEEMGYVEVDVTRMDDDWLPLLPRIDIPQSEESTSEVTGELQSQIEQLSHYELDEVALQRGDWHYYQLIEDAPVYVAPVEVRRENNTLTAYRQTYVEVTSRERTSTVVSAHAALKAAVEAQLIPAGSTVEHVRLGYIGQLKIAEPQFLVPVWRMTVRGLDPLYINALTGGIESIELPPESSAMTIR